MEGKWRVKVGAESTNESEWGERWGRAGLWRDRRSTVPFYSYVLPLLVPRDGGRER